MRTIAFILLGVLVSVSVNAKKSPFSTSDREEVSEAQTQAMFSQAMAQEKENAKIGYDKILVQEHQRINNMSDELMSGGFEDVMERLGLVERPAMLFCQWAATDAKEVAYYNFEDSELIAKRNKGAVCDCYKLEKKTVSKSQKAVKTLVEFAQALDTNILPLYNHNMSEKDNVQKQAYDQILSDLSAANAAQAVIDEKPGEVCNNLYKEYKEKLKSCGSRHSYPQGRCPTYSENYKCQK